MASRIYVDCECGEKVTIIEVDREVGPGDVLEPDENRDMVEAIYGRVPDPSERAPAPVIRCGGCDTVPIGRTIQAEPVEAAARDNL